MTEQSFEELKTLYLDLAHGELAIARDNLDRYLELAWEIFEDAELADVVGAAFPEPPSRGRIEERSILPKN